MMLEFFMQLKPDDQRPVNQEQMPDLFSGYYLRRLRESRGISQSELADDTLLSTSFISHLEDGTSLSSIPTADNICKVLEIPLFKLYEASVWFSYI